MGYRETVFTQLYVWDSMLTPYSISHILSPPDVCGRLLTPFAPYSN